MRITVVKARSRTKQVPVEVITEWNEYIVY